MQSRSIHSDDSLYPFYGFFELGKVIGFYGIYTSKDLSVLTLFEYALSLLRARPYHRLGGLKPGHGLDGIPNMMQGITNVGCSTHVRKIKWALLRILPSDDCFMLQAT